jgi:hypothetical protein
MKTSFTYGLLLSVSLVLMQHCGSPPPGMPDVSYGSLRIMAMDTASIRSIYFDLDDVKYGKHPNPFVLDQVVAGTHKLLVYDERNSGSVTAVEVFRDRRTEIKVNLLAEGPYVGGVAPNFTVKSIDDQTLSLEAMKGKVVLLAFFEHT